MRKLDEILDTAFCTFVVLRILFVCIEVLYCVTWIRISCIIRHGRTQVVRKQLVFALLRSKVSTDPDVRKCFPIWCLLVILSRSTILPVWLLCSLLLRICRQAIFFDGLLQRLLICVMCLLLVNKQVASVQLKIKRSIRTSGCYITLIVSLGCQWWSGLSPCYLCVMPHVCSDRTWDAESLRQCPKIILCVSHLRITLFRKMYSCLNRSDTLFLTLIY